MIQILISQFTILIHVNFTIHSLNFIILNIPAIVKLNFTATHLITISSMKTQNPMTATSLRNIFKMDFSKLGLYFEIFLPLPISSSHNLQIVNFTYSPDYYFFHEDPECHQCNFFTEHFKYDFEQTWFVLWYFLSFTDFLLP